MEPKQKYDWRNAQPLSNADKWKMVLRLCYDTGPKVWNTNDAWILMNVMLTEKFESPVVHGVN
jgi:hypothetical protein